MPRPCIFCGGGLSSCVATSRARRRAGAQKPVAHESDVMIVAVKGTVCLCSIYSRCGTRPPRGAAFGVVKVENSTTPCAYRGTAGRAGGRAGGTSWTRPAGGRSSAFGRSGRSTPAPGRDGRHEASSGRRLPARGPRGRRFWTRATKILSSETPRPTSPPTLWPGWC